MISSEEPRADYIGARTLLPARGMALAGDFVC